MAGDDKDNDRDDDYADDDGKGDNYRACRLTRRAGQ